MVVEMEMDGWMDGWMAGWVDRYRALAQNPNPTPNPSPGALFLGIAPTVVRAAPNLGIQFLLYELLKGSLGLL